MERDHKAMKEFIKWIEAQELFKEQKKQNELELDRVLSDIYVWKKRIIDVENNDYYKKYKVEADINWGYELAQNKYLETLYLRAEKLCTVISD